MTTGLINSFLMNLSAGVERTAWPKMYLLALAEIIVYFVVFVFIIKKFNLKTPGREDAVVVEEENGSAKTVSTSNDGVAEAIIEGLGGRENIENVDNCFTRLRVKVKDASLVNDAVINKVKNSGIVKKNNDIQVIFGIEVPQIRKAVDAALNK